ncbi:MAG: hypothetical protein IT368_04765 [Candidatus Hydrogenedentes bacterium]|nr:hypothetical protein [Candidatus Hydrogenedentota bacterium]
MRIADNPLKRQRLVAEARRFRKDTSQLTADANFSCQYDDNGNLTGKTILATGKYTQYTYDAENRLTKVEDFAVGNPTAITTSSYRYDGLGRRIEKVGNGQTKRYVYDGEVILLEYDGSNVLQARYTHGPGIDEPLSRTPMVPGLGSGRIAVLASTPDGLRGPVVDDGIKVNGQVSVGFVLASGVPTLVDAILDRLVHNASKITLKGESMRKRLAKLDGSRPPRTDS